MLSERLSGIFCALHDAAILPYAQLDAVADKLMELAKANDHRLVPA